MIPIFLDFEGVLRPAGDGGAFLNARLITPVLVAARAAGAEVGVIVASTHRVERDWPELADIVDSHAPGLGAFFAGANPFGNHLVASEEDHDFRQRAPRHFECDQWLRANSELVDGGWIAIDDTRSLYGRDGALPAQLLLIDGRAGFTRADGHALLDMIMAAKPALKASGPA